MRKYRIVLLLITVFLINQAFASENADKIKYSARYELRGTDNKLRNVILLSRDSDKIKFENMGMETGKPMIMYVFLDEHKVYYYFKTKDNKTGIKDDIDLEEVGILSGIYILDSANSDFFWKDAEPGGTETVAGIECKVLLQNKILKMDAKFSFYNNLMLKRVIKANTLEAVYFNENPEFSADEFILPKDITFYGK